MKGLENTVCDIQEKRAIEQVKIPRIIQEHTDKLELLKIPMLPQYQEQSYKWTDGKGTLPSQPLPGEIEQSMKKK